MQNLRPFVELLGFVRESVWHVDCSSRRPADDVSSPAGDRRHPCPKSGSIESTRPWRGWRPARATCRCALTVDLRLEGVDGRIEDLDQHMHVLHEEVIGRIADTREYTGPTREEFNELKEMIGRRLDPLEAAVRHHTVEIERLKQAGG